MIFSISRMLLLNMLLTQNISLHLPIIMGITVLLLTVHTQKQEL